MPMIVMIIATSGALRAAGSHLGMRRVQKVFHIGVHRTATTTFQDYLDRNQSCLADCGIATWTPRHLRGGLFSGMIRPPADTSLACERSSAMIGLTLARLARKSVRQLVVSEENMMGTIRVNIRERSLYPEAGPRLGRFARAFNGDCDRIVMGIRSYDSFWTSCFSYAARAGMPRLSPSQKMRIATGVRGWREVIYDVKTQFPDTPIHVTLFESFASRSKDFLGVVCGDDDVSGAMDHNPIRRNASQPCAVQIFDAHTRAVLRNRYDEDRRWLENGADGLARLIQPQQNQNDDMRGPKLAKAQHAAPYGGHHGTQQRMV